MLACHFELSIGIGPSIAPVLQPHQWHILRVPTVVPYWGKKRQEDRAKQWKASKCYSFLLLEMTSSQDDFRQNVATPHPVLPPCGFGSHHRHHMYSNVCDCSSRRPLGLITGHQYCTDSAKLRAQVKTKVPLQNVHRADVQVPPCGLL
jgi:hypothetical protein